MTKHLKQNILVIKVQKLYLKSFTVQQIINDIQK
jgi:hypothetical protein